MLRPISLVAMFAAATWCCSAHAQVTADGCGELANAYGPHDYRSDRDKDVAFMAHDKKLSLVEHAHFTPRIEALIRGESGPLGVELDYTLRAFPNHHRALVSVMRWGERANSPQPPMLPRPVECYFERALRFQPDDTVARLLYVTFLNNKKRKSDALAQIEKTRFYAGDNAFTHYNIALILLDLCEPDQALVHAHRAIALGLERTELKDKLVALGRWQDPAPLPPSPDAASAPASAK